MTWVDEFAADLKRRIELAFERDKPWDRSAAIQIAEEVAGPDWEFKVLETVGQPRFHVAILRHNPPVNRITIMTGSPNIVKRLPIPISAAQRIAKAYGYDQVVIMARRIDHALPPLNANTIVTPSGEEGEHITTYGINKVHCDVAALMGNTLKRIMGWPRRQDVADLNELYDDLSSGQFDYGDYDKRLRQVKALARLLGK